jgi:hypothetical protein
MISKISEGHCGISGERFYQPDYSKTRYLGAKYSLHTGITDRKTTNSFGGEASMTEALVYI